MKTSPRTGRLVAAFLMTAGAAALAVAQSPTGSGRDRAALVQRNATDVEAKSRQSKQQLEAISRKLDELTRKLEQLPPPTLRPPTDEKTETIELHTPTGGPSTEPPDQEKKEPEKLEFRLAEARKSRLPSGAMFVCRNSRVFVVDLDALVKVVEEYPEQAIQDAKRRSITTRDWVVVAGGPMPVAGGDYDLQELSLRPAGANKYAPRMKLSLKPANAGETVDMAMVPGSAFRTALDRFDPSKHNVQFDVFPTGHEVFRAIREEVRKRKYTDVGWFPYSELEPIYVGIGKAIVQ